MKTCSKCEVPKDNKSFCKDRQNKDGLQSVCKECKSIQIKKYYTLHPEKRQRKQKLFRHKTRKMLLESAGGKCTLCGYNKSMSALDFHHREPEQKSFGISVGLKAGYSYQKLLEESKKCNLVCSNCHHEIHDGLLNSICRHRLTTL
jgi:hypothetical protein